MKSILLLFAPLVLLFSAEPLWSSDEWPEGIEVDRVEGGKIYFKAPPQKTAPKPLATPLIDVTVLGMMQPSDWTPGAPPYLVLAAKACKDCLQDRAVFLLQATGRKPMQLVYPGKILDPKSGAVVYDSRAFFGKCLPETGNYYLSFQQDRVDKRRRLQLSVFVAQPFKEKIDEHLVERRMPKLAYALQRVRAKQCQEIEGRKRKQVTRPIDLLIKNRHTKEEDDEDEAPKENQTQDELPSPKD